MTAEQQETITKLHNALLEILDEIDRICRKHNIQYFLDSGTALGAIRHGGFIPWDDDADVGMLREEYERFIEVASFELSSKFFLQNQDTQPEYSQFNTKIRMNNTFFPEHRNEETNLHQGIFVDVFPFDYINDSPNEAKKDIIKSRRVIKMFAIRHRHPQKESVPRKLIRKVFMIIPEKGLREKCLKHFHKYDVRKTETIVCYSYKMNSNHFLWFKKQDMYPSKNIDFNGHQYMIMNNADAYLKTMYGDYLSLPPEDKRIWHFEGEIIYEM